MMYGSGIVIPTYGGAYQMLGSVHMLPLKKTISVDGDAYTTEFEYESGADISNYSFAKPVQIKTYSSVTTSPRTMVIEYKQNPAKWVMSKPEIYTQNGNQLSRYEFNANGQVTKQYNYNQLRADIAYNGDGTIISVADGLNRLTRLENWKRGTPQTVRQAYDTPDEVTTSRTVDDNGWVKSQTDALLNTTDYDHDDMGRLTKIEPPSPWHPTNITYDFTNDPVQTITKANSKTTITYDSMNRPLLERTQDLGAGASWESNVRKEYDALGRVIFTSLPSASTYPVDGVDNVYDGLGRLKSTTENFGGQNAVTYDFMSGHVRRTIDAAGKITSRHYSGYGGPNGGELLKIVQPMGVQTELSRNEWGEVDYVRQSGSHNGFISDYFQRFYYDGQRRVCRSTTPEGGHTLYDYDAAGQLIAYEKGAALSNVCVSPSGNHKVTLTHDDLGQLEDTLFTDAGTPDIMRTYDDNGNLLTLNRGSGADAVNWTYTYDNADNLKSESLSLDQQNFDMTYLYNYAGHMIQRTMPTGRLIEYEVDGLGRQTKANDWATTYADNITYHPNGGVEGLTYGNGFLYSQTQNARQLPQQTQIYKGAVSVLDFTYDYTARGKVSSTIDANDAANSRGYLYDGLGRLTSASGPWGSGSFVYDPVGNLRSKTLGSRLVDVSYNSSSNRAVSYADNMVNTALGYDTRGNVNARGGLSFVYDLSDQPVQLSGDVSGSYLYDGHKRRVRSIVDTGSSSAALSGAGTSASSARMAETDSLSTETDLTQSAPAFVDIPDPGPGPGEQRPKAEEKPKKRSSLLNLFTLSSASTSTASASSSGSSNTIYNIYDASGKLVYMKNISTGQEIDYIHAAGMTIARRDYGVSIRYQHKDHLGSASFATTATGKIWSERYTPFGETRLNQGFNDDQPGFTGHIKDKATGLNYMQARYHDPIMGRFLSIDPVDFMDTGLPGQFNRYAYTWNDPINANDPDGELINFIVGAAIGTVIEGISIAAEGGDPFDVKGNAGRYGKAALIGSVTGGVAGGVSKGIIKGAAKHAAPGQTTSKALQIGNQIAADSVGGAVGAAAGEITNQLVADGAITNTDKILDQAVTGGVFGAVASVGGQAAEGAVDAITKIGSGLPAAAGAATSTGIGAATNDAAIKPTCAVHDRNC